MRRSVAKLLTLALLWSCFVLPAGIAFGHEDFDLGDFHVDNVEITGHSDKTRTAKFGLNSQIELKVTFSEACYVDLEAYGAPQIFMRDVQTSQTIVFDWVGPAGTTTVHTFRHQVTAGTPVGELYKLYNFSPNDNSCYTSHGDKFNLGAVGDPNDARWMSFVGMLPNGIKIDRTAPTVTSIAVSSPANDYWFKQGHQITFDVTFSEPVVVSGSPYLTLSNGGQATYLSTSGQVVKFRYTVGANQDTINLQYQSLVASGSNTIKDEAGNEAVSLSPYMAAAVEKGWIAGTPGGDRLKLEPLRSITRAVLLSSEGISCKEVENMKNRPFRNGGLTQNETDRHGVWRLPHERS